MLNALKFTSTKAVPKPQPERSLFVASSVSIAHTQTPRTAAVEKLTRAETGMRLELEVVTAAIERVAVEPPPATTLQDKVRAARSRLTRRGLLKKRDVLQLQRENMVLLRQVLRVET